MVVYVDGSLHILEISYDVSKEYLVYPLVN